MYSLFNFSISNGQMHQTQGKTFLLKESFLSCKTGMFAVFLQHFHAGKEWKRKEGRLQLYFTEQLQSEVLNIIKTVFSLTENSPQEQTLQHRFYFPPIVPCYSMAYHTYGDLHPQKRCSIISSYISAQNKESQCNRNTQIHEE